MWAAMKSDLSEFVSGVAEETEQVLQTPGKEGEGSPPLVDEDGQVMEGGYEATGVISDASDEVLRRMEDIETYSVPLDEGDEDVQAFLDQFDIDALTDEISKLLEDSPDTIKKHFETLVPTEISYKLFWQRFYYRCDEQRIVAEWEAEQEAKRLARQEMIQGGISTVKNLFGGALTAVSGAATTDQSTAEVPVSPFLSQGTASKGAPSGLTPSGLNLFGAGGRPPFVMNTAVDDDEEEEELGWDDEDEEDDDDDDNDEDREDNDVDVSEEQITFSGGEFDKLREELAQAISERDSLKETVDLQAKEMTELKASSQGDAPSTDAADQIEKLSMQLFKKDSEIAALKASLEDSYEDNKVEPVNQDADAKVSALENDVERLNGELSEKNDQLSEKDAELGKLKELLEEHKQELARIRDGANSGQEVLQSSLDMAKVEAESLRQALESVTSSNEEELATAKKEAAAAKSNVESMTSELAEAKDELAAAMARAEEQESDMNEMMQQVTELQTALNEKLEKDRATPTSEESAVKVAAPATPKEGEDDEGWGDDW